MTLPEGTVTFFRSDIEGSMDLSRALGARYDELNAEHHALVRAAIDERGGRVVRTEGDAVFAVFTDAGAAARAAVDIQRAMTAHDWPAGHALRVRIGLHTGVATRAGDDYGGFEVSRAARIAAAGWGGQIVLSASMHALLEQSADADWSLRDLGRHRLRGLPEPERLVQLEAPGLTTEFPPLRSGRAETEHLPERQGQLIGRAAELEELARLLGGTRLLTLTGPGGSGKTTLALELARREAERYSDGAYLVDLQAVREVELVRAEIARGIGLLDGPTGSAADRLDSYLSGRELLIVIDNFEQVVAAAGVVSEVLASSPLSRIIVTSRVPLRLRAEQEYPVRPLRLDGSDVASSDALQLFADRARQARPGMTFDGAELETAAQICRRVDGLPLAIELCAARAAHLPLSTILDRLRGQQPLPGTGPRDLPDRQRTIEETVGWSVGLLPPHVQRLYARLAIFEESFALEQAQQVAVSADDVDVDVLDGIVVLAEASLLHRMADPAGALRFGWLQTIRDHAVASLAASGQGDAIKARHVRAFANLAAAAAPHLPGATQRVWLERLAMDDANLRAATVAAVELGDAESGLQLVAGPWRYWLQSGRLAEGRELVSQVLAIPGAEAPTPLRVRALDAAGSIAYWAGDMATATAFYEEELSLARDIADRSGEALALVDLFFVRIPDDPAGAEEARAGAETILSESGDHFGLARLRLSAIVLGLGGRATDFTPGAADADTRTDPFATALEAQAAHFEAYDDAWLSRLAPALRGYACLSRGELPQALGWLVDALRANLAVAERTDTALLIGFAVTVTPVLGRPDIAAEVHGASQAAFEQLGVRPLATYEELTGTDPIPAIEEALGEDAFAAAVERGRRLSLEEAIDRIEAIAPPRPASG